MSIDFSKISSPCYIIDENLLKHNLNIISSLGEATGVEIILALKGFAMWNIFPIIKQYISGAAASGLYEARLAYEELNSLAHTFSPAYAENDFNQVIEYSSHITFNSLSQYNRFLPYVKKFNRKISCGLRVNHEFSLVSTPLYDPCSPGSRLGITEDQLKGKIPEGIEGFHFHSLCESNSTDLEQTLLAFENKFGGYIHGLKWINMGGGHLFTRQGYDISHVIKILTDFKRKYNVHVILEPGSAFAWNTGVLLSTVLDIVDNKGIKTAILDISFTGHMPDCLEMPYKPRIRGAYMNAVPGKPTYRMGGNSCLAGDFTGDWSFDNPLQPGDLIVFEDMIHYTMVKTTFFNGVKHPSIGKWNDKVGFQIIKDFHYEDYKNKLS